MIFYSLAFNSKWRLLSYPLGLEHEKHKGSQGREVFLLSVRSQVGNVFRESGVCFSCLVSAILTMVGFFVSVILLLLSFNLLSHLPHLLLPLDFPHITVSAKQNPNVIQINRNKWKSGVTCDFHCCSQFALLDLHLQECVSGAVVQPQVGRKILH